MSPHAHDSAPGQVWLADDSPSATEHTRGVLAGAGHHVEAFGDGASLLERVVQPGAALPDVLLLDWHMPGVSGREVCRFLRERFPPTRLPILVLTASPHEEDLKEAFAAGASDSVCTPVRALELLMRVRTLVAVRRAAEGQRAQEEAQARALAEAEEARGRLTDILSTLQEGVLVQDAQGAVRYSNAAAERLLGLGAQQLEGRTSADSEWGAVWPDGRPAPGAEHAPMRALRTRERVTGEVLGLRHPDGRRLWFSINAQPLFERDGTTLAGVVSSFVDVTAQVAAATERDRLLREREEARGRLASLFENAPFSVCAMRGPDHVVELTNPLYAQAVGVGRPMLGLPMREALPELVEQGIVTMLDQVFRTGEPFVGREVPLRLDRKADGHLEDVFFNFVNQPRRDGAGHVIGIDSFGFDVTEQVHARQRAETLAAQLRESAERLRRVLEASTMGTWELDVPAQHATADARHLALMGLPAAPVPPLAGFMAAIHPEDRPAVERAMAAACAGEDGGRFHVVFRAVGALHTSECWVEARGQALRDAEGRPMRLVGTSLDVTARKLAEAAREELLTALVGQPVFGMALLTGPEHVFTRVNEVLRQQMVGGRDVEGKPHLEAVPEVVGQGFDVLLNRV